MNLDRLDRKPIPSLQHTPGNKTTTNPVKHHTSSQTSRLISAAPSDPAWVSPFTLPPLPAFSRNRRSSTTFRSPEQVRSRAGSGAYYAAAWGSPYATPSPQRPSDTDRATKRNIDAKFHFELTFQPIPSQPHLESSASRSYVHEISNPPSAVVHLGAEEASWSLDSERPNWWSDPEGSDKEIFEKEKEQQEEEEEDTPRVLDSEAGWGLLVAENPKRIATAVHKSSESIATITPETFTLPNESKIIIVSYDITESKSDVTGLHLSDLVDSSHNMAEKPLPTIPPSPQKADIDAAMTNPVSPPRSRTKRKVMWKGKTCIIALPLIDREALGLPPLMTPAEVRRKIESLVVSGYNVNGFELSNESGIPLQLDAGQSRPLFPDPQDLLLDQRLRNYNVHIPDQEEWNTWVDFLKEEKLRALGVTPSNSDVIPPTQSPFSAPLSRSSSRFPSSRHSPPIGSISTTVNPLRPTSNPYSLSGTGSPGTGPLQNGLSNSVHAYKKSIIPAGPNVRLPSPLDYTLSHSSFLGPQSRSPAYGYGQRKPTPTHMMDVQNTSDLMLPIAGDSGSEQSPNSFLNPLANSFTNSRQNQQYSLQSTPHVLSQSQGSLPGTPSIANPSRPALEIVHPTPRSHRHNLSAALQKGIENDDIDSAFHCGERDTTSVTMPGSLGKEQDEKNLLLEDDPEDLPVLKRPELVDETNNVSDLETNPSISASPLLEDDQRSHAEWQPSISVAKGCPNSLHKLKPSLSRLNVGAPEFDPQGEFSASNFSFESSPRPLTGSRKTSAARKPSLSHLNVDAPLFKPANITQSSEDMSAFTFSSANFNVKAPTFNPSTSLISDFASSIGSRSEEAAAPLSSIFEGIVIDTQSKPVRRVSKAVPILRPRSKDGPPNSENKPPNIEDEEDGRPSAPSDRQKRARRNGSGGDYSPVFAEAETLNNSRILSEIVNDVKLNGIKVNKTKEKPVDGWAYIPATEKSDFAKSGDSDSQDDGQKFHESAFSFTSNDDEHLANLSEVASTNNSISLSLSNGTRSHKPRSSLSALAKPFEFKPSIPSVPEHESTLQHPTRAGFVVPPLATSTAPRTEASTNFRAPDSSKLYEYIKSEDEISLKDKRKPEHPDEDSISSGYEEAVRLVEDLSDIEKDIQHEHVNQVVPPELTEDDEDLMPSYEEIDAVMKQFESNPELGIERNDTPIQSTPLVDMGLGSNVRSDAPSPSPRRMRRGYIEHEGPVGNASYGLGIGVHRLNRRSDEVSNWNDELSPGQEEKVESRAHFFDGHVNDLVDGILEHRLGPLERTLQTIQHSISLMAPQAQNKNARRSVSTDMNESDADDEDDYDVPESFTAYLDRPQSSRRNKTSDKVRLAVAEALAAHKASLLQQSTTDISEIHSTLDELREEIRRGNKSDYHDDVRATIEDVVEKHTRLTESRLHSTAELDTAKFKLQIDNLESMLEAANVKLDNETRMRREKSEEVAELRRKLAHAEDRANSYQTTSNDVQQSLNAFVKEKEAYTVLEHDFEQLTLKNEALESTLKDYRTASDEWRDDIRQERLKNSDLNDTLRELREQLKEGSNSRKALRAKVEKLQDHISHVVQDLQSEQAEWRQKEHEMSTRAAIVQSTLDIEIQRRTKTELELENLTTVLKENLHHKDRYDYCQQDIARLQDSIATLHLENRSYQDKVYGLERELQDVRNSKDAQVTNATLRLQAELDSALSRLQNVNTDSEAQITRLQNRLDTAEIDIEDQKAKHDGLLTETIEAHVQALREAEEKRETALEEQHASHEKKLTDLRERHTRALHNSSDDRHRLEIQLNEKLAMSEDKIKHLEGKLVDLDERLQITKSAARAAVEAAMAKTANIPTPAPSVVASPPQRVPSASIIVSKGSELPEKISPQALRESIMVLQDQLQNREQTIEKLEAELTAVDKEAPNKVKEQETEIGWLRELLSVRVDDIEEIVKTLSQQDFDRDAAKDAAIRLKANIQMEQQLKERAAEITYPFPSLSTLTNYAQSPRALPMAAAAAWGNWRKARDTSIGAISDLATNLGNQTPSKSTIGSPASFLSSIMTPPGTLQRSVTEPMIPPPSMRPLAAAAAARKGSSEARPLRMYNLQPRTLSSRQLEKKAESYQLPSSPHTPVSTRPNMDLEEDIDEDASPLESREPRPAEDAVPSSS